MDNSIMTQEEISAILNGFKGAVFEESEHQEEKVLPDTPQNRLRLRLAKTLLKFSQYVSGLY